MKKILSILSCILMLTILILPVHAASATQMTITPSAVTAAPGDEITFEVTVSGENACTSFGLKLEYDASVFELVSGKCLYKDGMMKLFDPDKGFAFLHDEAVVPSGPIGTFTLKVKADAPSGATKVSGTPSVMNGGEAVASQIEAAQITISGSGSSTTATESASQAKPADKAPDQTQATDTAVETAQPAVDAPVQEDAAETTAPEQPAPEDSIAVEAVATQGTIPALLTTPGGEVNTTLILCFALAVLLLVTLVTILVWKIRRR